MEELSEKLKLLENKLKQIVEDFGNENECKIIFIDKFDPLKPLALVDWLKINKK